MKPETWKWCGGRGTWAGGDIALCSWARHFTLTMSLSLSPPRCINGYWRPIMLIGTKILFCGRGLEVPILKQHISIITQVIKEILALSLAENGVIFCYNHLRRGDYSERANFQMAASRFVDVSEEEIHF